MIPENLTPPTEYQLKQDLAALPKDAQDWVLDDMKVTIAENILPCLFTKLRAKIELAGGCFWLTFGIMIKYKGGNGFLGKQDPGCLRNVFVK